MDKTERGRRITERKEQLVSGLDAHIAALWELEATTRFNFDVATDIHPDLLFDTPKGKKQLEIWQDLFNNLRDGPKSIATIRWNTGMVRGCHGFSQEPQYETKNIWIHVYENVTSDDIVFVKGDIEYPSDVVIDLPHQSFIWDQSRIQSVSETDEEQGVLYREQSKKLGSMRDWVAREKLEEYASNEMFIYGDTVLDVTRDANRLLDSPVCNFSIGARMRASDFLYKNIRKQLDQAKRDSSTS